MYFIFRSGPSYPLFSQAIEKEISNMTQPEPSTQSMNTEEKREALTQCLLSQYRLCAAGVVGGGAYSVLKASKAKIGPWPMLGGGFVGTLGDFMYGYFVECAHLRESEDIFGVREEK